MVSPIMLGALHGLHAAREAKGEQGMWGVAKAAGRRQNTREGQLKRKIAYLSPEQVRGEEATPASDVFSTAVVSWESLTLQHLISAPNEVAATHAILEGKRAPPSRRALSTRRDRRSGRRGRSGGDSDGQPSPSSLACRRARSSIGIDVVVTTRTSPPEPYDHLVVKVRS